MLYTIQLTRLFAGSLSPSISPHDTTLAIDGFKQLIELHNIFCIQWFNIYGCLRKIIKSCIYSILNITQPLLTDALIDLLAEAQKSPYLQNSTDLGFWVVLGQETYQWANDNNNKYTANTTNITEYASILLNNLFITYPNNGEGLDMSIYMNTIIHPLIAESSKSKA